MHLSEGGGIGEASDVAPFASPLLPHLFPSHPSCPASPLPSLLIKMFREAEVIVMTQRRTLRNGSEQAATVPFLPGHCGSVKQDNKRYFILYLQLASCAALPDERTENWTKRFFWQECKADTAAVIFTFFFLSHPCCLALQGYARYPVDESRSSQADGGTESVHITGGI